MSKQKYIIFTDGTFKIFDVSKIHSWEAGTKPVKSAGFIEDNKTFGESTTLKVKSDPNDINILKPRRLTNTNRDTCTCDTNNIKDCPYCHQTLSNGSKSTCFNVACKDIGE